jgi:hypothetical protein
MERRMRKHIAAGALLALGVTGSALAADGVDYNLLEGGYGYTDFKHTSVHGDQLSIGGSFEFGGSFVAFGNLSTVDVSGFSVKGATAGLGWHGGISSALDFLVGASFELVDPEGGGSETGVGASVGIRGRASDKLEFNGGLKYVDFGHGADGVVFTVGSHYYFTDAFAAGLDISLDDEADSTTFGIRFRYDFGT